MDQQFNAMHKQWWSEGDFPVRTHNTRVTWLLHGRTTLFEMCLHFLKARHTLYLGNWGLSWDMQLVRGEDHHPPRTSTVAYNAYVQKLRAEGLQEQDINFWLSNELTVKNVLNYVCQKGVEVKVLLWKTKKAFAVYDEQATYEHLHAQGIPCLIDDSAEGILHHPVESLHQKMTVIDTTYAFIGGIDPLIEKGREFDRWDTAEHPFETPLRINDKGQTPHGWHDVHALIEGPAAADIEKNFRQRWNDVITHHHLDTQYFVPERPLPAEQESQSIVQIVRTVPKHTYTFDRNAIRDINQIYTHALANSQQYLYIENQYLWFHAYYGIDLPFMGNISAEMEEHLQQIATALQQEVSVSVILPDHPNAGRALTDAGITRVRELAGNDEARARFFVFTLASSSNSSALNHQNDTNAPRQETHYRPIYVHAKVAIVDDIWATIGSANLNNRGMCDDTEINIALLDTTLPQGLRLLLQGEHLNMVTDDEMRITSRLLSKKFLSSEEQVLAEHVWQRLVVQLQDPYQALRLMQQRADENLIRYKTKQPLLGHLLPYLTADEAQQQELDFQEEHGWIEERTQV